ncbi:MAG: MFS transporter [Spirochaetaceae bacterium]|jgi:OPA family glycerol-3-phosphate transporter-like MFS transporter|nr:MFS transporter [Spirochaetaceae bacterium]
MAKNQSKASPEPLDASDLYKKNKPAEFARYLMRRKAVFAVSFLGYVCAYLVRNNFKLLSKDMASIYNWSLTDIGFLLTAFSVTYGIGKFVMGIIADKTSLKKLFALSLGASALICVAIGFNKSFVVLAILLFLLGLIQGALAPSSQAMIANWFPNKSRGGGIAMWNISQNAGSALLPLVVSGLGFVSPTNNILLAFVIPGVVVFALSFIFWRFGGDAPEKEGMDSLRTMYGAAGEPDVGEESDRSESYFKLIFKYVFLNPSLLIVAFINAALYFVRFGIEDWMPLYLGDAAIGFEKTQYLMAISVLEWIAIPGSIFFAWLSVKLPNKQTIVGAFGLFVLAALVFLYKSIQNTGTSSYILLLVVSGCMGALIYGPQLIVNILTVNFVPLKVAGTAIGFVGLAAYVLGNLGANLVMPLLAEHVSWSVSYTTVSSLAVVSAIGYLVLAKRERAVIKA